MADNSQQALLNRQSELLAQIQANPRRTSKQTISELNNVQKQLRSKYDYNYSEQPNFKVTRGELRADKSDFSSGSSFAQQDAKYQEAKDKAIDPFAPRLAENNYQPTQFSGGSGQLNTTNATSLGSTPVTANLRPESGFESARRLQEYEQTLTRSGYTREEAKQEVDRLKAYKDVRIDPDTGRAYGFNEGSFERLPDTQSLVQQNRFNEKVESGQIKVRDIIPEGKQLPFIFADAKGNIINSAEAKSNIDAVRDIVTTSERNRNERISMGVVGSETSGLTSSNSSNLDISQGVPANQIVEAQSTPKAILSVQPVSYETGDAKINPANPYEGLNILLDKAERKLTSQIDLLQTASVRDSSVYNNPLTGIKALGAGATLRVVQIGKAIINPIDTIVGTAKALSSPVENIAKPLIALPNKLRAGTPAENAPIVGALAVDVAFAELGGRVQTSIKNVAKDTYIKVGAKEVPLEVVEAPQVQAGARFPTVSSIKESIERFTKAKTPQGTFEVVTASPSKIAGDTIGAGSKGSAGLEDVGLYVTPKGEASTYFTGLKTKAEGGYSLNPVKDILDIPSITTFEVKQVTQYPRAVIQKAGFEPVNLFQEQVLAPKGVAVITKRSEIGLANVPKQKFVAKQDFTEGNFNIKEGQTRFEAGTSEIEAVIPKGSKFEVLRPTSGLAKFKGFEEYTIINGRAVALPKARVLSANDLQVVSPKVVLASEKQIMRGINAYSTLSTASKEVSFVPLATSFSEPTNETIDMIVTPLDPVPEAPSTPPVSSVIETPPISSIITPIVEEISTPVIEESNTSPIESSSGSNFELPNSSTIISEPESSASSSLSGSDSILSTSQSILSTSRIPSARTSATPSSIYSTSVSPILSTSRATSVPSYKPPTYGSAKTPLPKAPTIPSIAFSDDSKGLDLAFDVFVREKGKLVKVNKRPQSLLNAKNLGADYTDNTPTRTFKIIPIKARPQSAETSYQFDPRKYKQKGGAFIESSRFAINTGGELKGITLKGLSAKKNKAMNFNNILGKGKSLKIKF